MNKRILMVYDETLLELTKGRGMNCWFRKQGLCMDCAADTALTKMCRVNRLFLSLNSGWNWKVVAS